MSSCQHCTRKTELYLCTPCTHTLADLLAELPWLLHELDVTMTRQDRLVLGSGSAHQLTNPSPINVGAMEIARAAAVTLQQIALDVAQTYASARIPALTNATPSRAAMWLRTNVGAIQLRPRAGEHYTAIADLVGETRAGQIHRAINRADTRFAGPCPTVRAHDRTGSALTCNTMLYAHDGEPHVTCPRCDSSVDVEQNRRKAVTDNDLLPEHLLLEALRNYGANVDRSTLYGWITTGRLRARAYVTSKGIAKRRIRASDPEAFSFTAALRLSAQTPADLRIVPKRAAGPIPKMDAAR